MGPTPDRKLQPRYLTQTQQQTYVADKCSMTDISRIDTRRGITMGPISDRKTPVAIPDREQQQTYVADNCSMTDICRTD